MDIFNKMPDLPIGWSDFIIFIVSIFLYWVLKELQKIRLVVDRLKLKKDSYVKEKISDDKKKCLAISVQNYTNKNQEILLFNKTKSYNQGDILIDTLYNQQISYGEVCDFLSSSAFNIKEVVITSDINFEQNEQMDLFVRIRDITGALFQKPFCLFLPDEQKQKNVLKEAFNPSKIEFQLDAFTDVRLNIKPNRTLTIYFYGNILDYNMLTKSN